MPRSPAPASLALIAVASLLSACSEQDPTAPATTATGFHAVPRSTASFINGQFETDLTGWTKSFYLNNLGISSSACTGTGASMVCSPTDKSQLQLAAGTDDSPTSRTRIINGTEGTVDAEGVNTGELLLPKWGNGSVVVNDMGQNYKGAGIVQTMTITYADVDPADGKVHVRFALAPVLQNPNHNANQQPYFFAELTKVDAGGNQIGQPLFYTFNYSNQPGVPWKTSGTGALYTDWQAFDIAPGNATLAPGDMVKLEVVAAGCSQGGHHGHVYLDGVGAFLPGLSVAASAPQKVNTGSQFTYALNYRNGGNNAAGGVQIEQTIPTGATYVSASGPGGACTTTGSPVTKVTCPVGTLNPSGTGTVQVVVSASGASGSTIANGNYRILASNTAPLLGPLVLTSITNGVTYADLAVSASGAAAVTWGQTMPATTFVVTNNGPSAVSGATFAFTPPADLGSVTWTCVGTGGGTCAASGTGAISDSVNLPASATATYTVHGTVAAGSGASTLRQVGTITVPSGVQDSNTANNTAVQTATVGDAVQTLTIANTGGGTVVSTPAGISCGGTCQAQFTTGSQVVLTATADTGEVFTGWSGGGCGTSATCTVTLSADTTITANFATGYYVSASRTGTGSGTITCQSPVASGNSSTCTLVPGTGSYLSALTDNGTNVLGAVSGGAYVISNVTAAHTVVATFTTSNATIGFTFSPASPTLGQAISFTATVSFSGSPSGIVSFTDESGNVLCTASPVGGTATCSASTLALGTHVVTASYSGDATNNPCVSQSKSVTVAKINTTTAITTPVPFGQPLTASVTPASSPGGLEPSGTLTFTEGGTTLCTATLVAGSSSSTASCSPATPLAVGSHTLTATYGGDSSFNGSAATGATLTVAKASSVVTPTTTVTTGQALTADVGPASGTGTPTGTVTFTEGGTTLCTATLASGHASCSPATPLSAADHTIVVSYGGDTSFNGSSATATVHVQKVNTSTAITTPVPFGQPLTASVTPASSPGGVEPSGTLTFTEGGTTLCTATLVAGSSSSTASCSPATQLATGSHTLTATYGGDSSFNGSAASSATVTVAMASSVVTTPVTTVISGQTLAADLGTAPGGAGTPTGTVTFSEGGTTLCTATLVNGHASCSPATPLSGGDHVLTIAYTGDSSFIGSSASATVRVQRVNTTTALTVTPSPSVSGQPATVMVAVVPAIDGAGTPTGTVDLLDGSKRLARLTLSGGRATFSSAALAVGTHALSGQYAGDASFNGSSGSTDLQVGSSGAVGMSCQSNADCDAGNVCAANVCAARDTYAARSDSGGCGSSGGALPSFAMLLGVVLAWARGAVRRRTARVAVLAITVAAAPAAQAQVSGSFALQTFEPSPPGDTFFTVRDASNDRHGAPSLGLTLSWAHDPLVVRRNGVTVPGGRMVHRQFWGFLGAAFPAGDRVLVDVSAPVALYQSGSQFFSDVPRVSSSDFGDLRVGARAALLPPGPWNLALGADLWVPTGSRDAFMTDKNARLEPKLIVGREVGPWSFGAQTGVLLREDRDLLYTRTGPALSVAAGAAYRTGAWRVGPEFYGRYQFRGEVTSPWEALVGAHWSAGAFELGGGLGTSFDRAPGASPFRALLQAVWRPERTPEPPAPAAAVASPEAAPAPAPTPQPAPPPPAAVEEPAPVEPPPAPPAPPADRDGDGIPDAVDACPDEPGVASPDPARSGCKPLAVEHDDRIELREAVQFETGEDHLLPASDPLLAEVARILRDHPEIAKVRVEGYTDSRGSRAKNLDLSRRRALAVKTWLMQKGGVAAGRLATQGFGPDRPVASNLTEEGRAKNRRVELMIAK